MRVLINRERKRKYSISRGALGRDKDDLSAKIRRRRHAIPEKGFQRSEGRSDRSGKKC